MRVTAIQIIVGVLSCHQRIGSETGRLGNKRTSGGHPSYSIIKIGQNNEKSPGDSRKLAVT